MLATRSKGISKQQMHCMLFIIHFSTEWCKPYRSVQHCLMWPACLRAQWQPWGWALMTLSNILFYSCKVPLQKVVYSPCPSCKTVISYLVAFLDTASDPTRRERSPLVRKSQGGGWGGGTEQGCKGNQFAFIVWGQFKGCFTKKPNLSWFLHSSVLDCWFNGHLPDWGVV